MLGALIRGQVDAGTSAATNAKIYWRGNQASRDVLVPPSVALFTRQYLEGLGAEKIEGEPSIEGYQHFDL